MPTEQLKAGEQLSYLKKTTIKIPNEHPVRKIIDSIKLFDLEKRENFKRQFVVIKDKEGGEIGILICKDDYKPTNRGDVGFLGRVIYGGASNVGSIEFLKSKIEKPFEEADSLAFEKAKKITQGCEQSGIKSTSVHNNIQLSGAHIVVIEDSQKKGLANSDRIQEAISFLFGPNGNLNDVIVFPEEGQKILMDKIKMAGGQTLLCSNPESGLELGLSRFNKLRKFLNKVETKKSKGKITKDEKNYLIKALLSNIPFMIKWHNQLMENNEVFNKPKYLSRYLKSQLKGKLQSLEN